jgi:tRNA(Glu) U13 pseudouridine synthase TruD
LAGDVSPTGPILGPKMRWPEGVPAGLERRIADQMLGPGTDLSPARALGDGSRRALRVWAQDLTWERCAPSVPDDRSVGTACMRVGFVLPKGAYATTVLASAFQIEPALIAREDDPPSEKEDRT